MSSSHLIANRYAKALFQIGMENDNLKQLQKQLSDFAQIFTKNSELSQVIKSPLISVNAGKNIAHDLAKLANLDKISEDFVAVIASHGRLALINDIALGFLKMVENHLGVKRAIITSAEKLSDENTKNIEKMLMEMTGASKIIVEYKQNPAIIGGLIVNVGSMQIDNSILNKLNQCATRMKGA